MQEQVSKPVFVVGSPRSGTSILVWCLGHHPNLFPVPESNWMGGFAVNVAIAYQIGVARGDYSILSAMDIRDDELFAAFGRSINDLILRHRSDLERKREARSKALKLKARWLEATNTAAGPKGRWVDGTPEYSFYICGLRKLFPGALFVHIFRDVHSVVRSMLNFHQVAGTRLVPNAQEGYRYWLRTVRACVMAEQAYGPNVVYRIRYSDLIDTPESAMRSLLDFLGEPYTAKCLEPLTERINSSNVPVDFKTDDPETDTAIVKHAKELSDALQSVAEQRETSYKVAEQLETEFNQQVQYFAELGTKYSEAQDLIARLQQECALLRASPAGGIA